MYESSGSAEDRHMFRVGQVAEAEKLAKHAPRWRGAVLAVAYSVAVNDHGRRDAWAVFGRKPLADPPAYSVWYLGTLDAEGKGWPTGTIDTGPVDRPVEDFAYAVALPRDGQDLYEAATEFEQFLDPATLRRMVLHAPESLGDVLGIAFDRHANYRDQRAVYAVYNVDAFPEKPTMTVWLAGHLDADGTFTAHPQAGELGTTVREASHFDQVMPLSQHRSGGSVEATMTLEDMRAVTGD